MAIGEVDNESKRLMDATHKALYAGISAVKVDGRIGDIGEAVNKVVRDAGFYCIENYSGHGLGRALHEDPQVFNQPGQQCHRHRIRPGLTIAIEPMVAVGTPKTMELKDGWTVVTKDKSRAAHYEHSIAVTKTGVEILTLDPELEDSWKDLAPNSGA